MVLCSNKENLWGIMRMKKMVIGGTYIYCGKGYSHNTVRKVRDGGIVELGFSSWENDEQWIEVLEDNLFIGFINSKTKLVDLRNYFYVIQDSLPCYEKPDLNSELAVSLKQFDKIYLVSKLFSKGHMWLKTYDNHGFCCYIDYKSCICPNRFIPYTTTLAESTIMYVTSGKKGIYKTKRLKKKIVISVSRLVAYRQSTGLDTSYPFYFDDDDLQLFSDEVDLNLLKSKWDLLFKANLLDTLTNSDDVWLEIRAYGLTGYIPFITKTETIPYLDSLPVEHPVISNNFNNFFDHNRLIIPGVIFTLLGIILYFIIPTFPISGIYLCVLGMCLILLKIFSA